MCLNKGVRIVSTKNRDSFQGNVNGGLLAVGGGGGSWKTRKGLMQKTQQISTFSSFESVRIG